MGRKSRQAYQRDYARDLSRHAIPTIDMSEMGNYKLFYITVSFLTFNLPTYR